MDKMQLLEKLKKQGFSNKIASAFEKVPRENFVPDYLRDFAYEDEALPLGTGASISQPYTIAFMLGLLELKLGQKILEIGSGSGYALALLSEITNGEIYGVEIMKSLAEKSMNDLIKYSNIKVINRNGSYGLPEEAPFDRILISADTRKIPEHLYSQLKDNGILVTSVKDSIFQIKKMGAEIVIKKFQGFIFVPLRED